MDEIKHYIKYWSHDANIQYSTTMDEQSATTSPYKCRPHDANIQFFFYYLISFFMFNLIKVEGTPNK